MAFIILGFLVAVPLVMYMVGVLISGPKYHGPVSDHFDGSRFINPAHIKPKGAVDLFKWMFHRHKGPWSEKQTTHGTRPLSHFSDGIRVTFVNHSTFLIQVDGLNILTDPVWSRRASPFRSIGPKRMTTPGIRFEDLPRIHLVLLSHNHYDHLDVETMRTIFGAYHPRTIVPLGVKAFLEQQSIRGANEVDWWDEVEIDDNVKLQAVPAQHFSGRGLLDRDATLWCGYVLRTGSGNIYFAGDTGYNTVTFKEVGARCGPMRVSLLPIGAYKPGWFMSPIHVSPEQAISIHADVKSETSIGMHFGTFPLADDGQDDPATDLESAMAKHGISPERFLIPKEGEAMVFD